MAKKVCSRCKIEKDVSEFRKARRYKDGLFCWCKECHKVHTRERERQERVKAGLQGRRKRREVLSQRNAACRRWQERNPQKRAAIARNGNLQREYGITQQDYDAMLARQGGRCACCGKVSAKILNVDHTEVGGKVIVRGLICYSCNRGIALLGDDEAGINRALEYLRGQRSRLYEPFTFCG